MIEMLVALAVGSLILVGLLGAHTTVARVGQRLAESRIHSTPAASPGCRAEPARTYVRCALAEVCSFDIVDQTCRETRL